MHIKIRKPIWKNRSIGIRDDLCHGELTIEITYTVVGGSRLYPYLFTISGEEARKYPVQIWKEQKLHIVPIKDLRRKDDTQTSGNVQRVRTYTNL